MKKNRSGNLQRAWPSSELGERPLEHNLSRSEKDIRVQKQHLPPPPPPHFSQSPPSYRAPGKSDPPTNRSSTHCIFFARLRVGKDSLLEMFLKLSGHKY